MQLLTFRIGGALVGIPTDEVEEILDVCTVTPLPLLPAGFVGVADVGGAPVPVADVAQLTGLGTAADRTAIVVLRRSFLPLALRIDRPEAIVAASGLGTVDAQPAWMAGMADGIAVLDTRSVILSREKGEE